MSSDPGLTFSEPTPRKPKAKTQATESAGSELGSEPAAESGSESGAEPASKGLSQGGKIGIGVAVAVVVIIIIVVAVYFALTGSSSSEESGLARPTFVRYQSTDNDAMWCATQYRVRRAGQQAWTPWSPATPSTQPNQVNANPVMTVPWATEVGGDFVWERKLSSEPNGESVEMTRSTSNLTYFTDDTSTLCPVPGIAPPVPVSTRWLTTDEYYWATPVQYRSAFEAGGPWSAWSLPIRSTKELGTTGPIIELLPAVTTAVKFQRRNIETGVTEDVTLISTSATEFSGGTNLKPATNYVRVVPGKTTPIGPNGRIFIINNTVFTSNGTTRLFFIQLPTSSDGIWAVDDLMAEIARRFASDPGENSFRGLQFAFTQEGRVRAFVNTSNSYPPRPNSSTPGTGNFRATPWIYDRNWPSRDAWKYQPNGDAAEGGNGSQTLNRLLGFSVVPQAGFQARSALDGDIGQSLPQYENPRF